jgi:hypothetical protein
MVWTMVPTSRTASALNACATDAALVSSCHARAAQVRLDDPVYVCM